MHAHTNGYHEAAHVTWVSMAINLLLGVVKVIAGVLGNSWAVIADGVHTLSDLLSSVAILVGLRIARRAPDTTHPYGHGKAEVIAARSVALLLLIVAGFIVHEAASKLLNAADIARPRQIALWAAFASILVKEGLFRYKERAARRTGSASLHADAWHHRSDALTSFAALLGVAAAILSGGRLNWLDPVAALLVACIILWITFRIFATTMGELMDAAAPDEVTDAIRDLALAVDGVLGVEKVRCRKAGLNYLVDIHVEVAPSLRVDAAHDIAAAVRDRLVARGPHVLQALVHIEPYYPDDH